MRCIFCLQERPPSCEHVFPIAIGGKLTTNRVCSECNSTLGSRVDAALSDNFLVRMRRAKLGIPGNSGKPPAMHEMLLGTPELAEFPGRKIEVKYDSRTGKLDLRALHHAIDIDLPDGTKVRQITVDVRDKDQLPKIIQRERKRHGLNPLPPEELDAEIERFTSSSVLIENPTVHYKHSFYFEYLRHGIIKIVYELAFLWLGEEYIDDPEAVLIRQAILERNPNSTDGLAAVVGEAKDFDAFRFWSNNHDSHFAYAFALREGIAVAVRIFDIFAGFVWVTKDRGRYLAAPGLDQKLRFLSIEPVTGTMETRSISEELLRIISENRNKADEPLVA